MNIINLVPITLFILLIGHYFITIINVIANWIYIWYMRPLKIEDARIVSEEQLYEDEEEDDEEDMVEATNENIFEINTKQHYENMVEKDEVEDFIDYSRHNHSDEDEHYNEYFSLNDNSYAGPDYNFNDGDW